MKKIFKIVFLCSLLLCMFGCSKGIELTVDNYKDYLEVSGSIYKNKINAPVKTDVYYFAISGDIDIIGASNNYDYNNVEITVTIVAVEFFDDTEKTKTVSEDYTISLNIAGKGSHSFEIPLENFWHGTEYEAYANQCDADPVRFRGSFPNKVDVYYEIKDISGTVSK